MDSLDINELDDIHESEVRDEAQNESAIHIQNREEIEVDHQVITTKSFKKRAEEDDDINLNQTFESTVQKLIENYDDDREELTKNIKLMSKEIGKTGGKAVRIYYETLANLLRTRSESNATLIKLIENIGRRMDKAGSGLGDIADMIDED